MLRSDTATRVLDAAERLLGRGDAAFSMRDLAAEAGTSFATPFNRFGSKGAIMFALSARRIETMHDRLAASTPPRDAPGRVLSAVDVAAAVMLEAPAVNRAVMAAIGAPNGERGGERGDGQGGGRDGDPGAVSVRSAALWSAAVGNGTGLAAPMRSLALETLPAQLAIVFRGTLSFWTAGELADAALPVRARAAAAAVLLGFAEPHGREPLLRAIEAGTGAGVGAGPGATAGGADG